MSVLCHRWESRHLEACQPSGSLQGPAPPPYRPDCASERRAAGLHEKDRMRIEDSHLARIED